MLQPAAQTCTSPLIVSSCFSPSSSDVVDSHTSDTDADAQDLNTMQSPSILHLSFNQDAGCFAVGTTDGFALFNTDPFGESLRRNSGLSGVGIVHMLFRSNILALADADGSSRNKVLIWDDRLNHCVFQLLFRSEVKAVRLRRDRIVVVMLQKIYVYDFFNYKLIHQIETQENPEGVCEISQTAEPMVLVCLGLQRGLVRVEQYATKQCKHVMAHNSSVTFVALMHDGRLMATASTKGTLVRVFSTADGSLLQEISWNELPLASFSRIVIIGNYPTGIGYLHCPERPVLLHMNVNARQRRRGSERAVIFSLCFSMNAQWLAVSSDKGTVHVFSLKVESAQRNKCVSRLSFIKGVVPKYFSSEWSMAQFHVQEGLRHIVVFGQQENTISIVGYDGSFYRCQFDPVLGGEMTQLESHHF